MDLSNIKVPTTMDAMGKVIVGLAVAFVSYSVNEIRTDVKQLMAASNVNTTKIEGIEARVNNLEQVVIFDKLNKKASSNDSKKAIFPKLYATIKDDEDITKKLATRL